MNLSQTIKQVVQLATTKIAELVSKELDGREKKAQVDAAVTAWVSDNVSKLGVVQQFIITQYFIPTIPIITQSIYDCLKIKMEGLTQ